MHEVLLSYVDEIYEDLVLWYPRLRLEEAGYGTRLARHDLKYYAGKHGYPAPADVLINQVPCKDLPAFAKAIVEFLARR